MTLSELVARVQAIFGDENEVVVTEADIVNWANSGQLELARRTEALEDIQSSNIVAGTSAYPVASDFLLETRVTWNGYGLTRKTKQELARDYPNRDVENNSGSILYYYISGRNLHVYPTPTASEVGVGNLKLEYVKRPTALVLVTQEVFDLPVEMHDDLVDYCLVKAKELDDDLSAAGYYRDSFKDKAGVSAANSQFPYADTYPSVRDTDGW
jgi:hypothetical protein